MKTPIVLTLILVGGLLIVAPAIADHFHARNTVELLAKPEIKSVNISGEMSETYTFGCWFAGVAMIGTAVVCSVRYGRGGAI